MIGVSSSSIDTERHGSRLLSNPRSRVIAIDRSSGSVRPSAPAGASSASSASRKTASATSWTEVEELSACVTRSRRSARARRRRSAEMSVPTTITPSMSSPGPRSGLFVVRTVVPSTSSSIRIGSAPVRTAWSCASRRSQSIEIELAVGASDRGTGRDAERRAHRVVRDQVAAGTILHAERHAHPFGDRRQQRLARSHQRLGGPLGGHLERGAEERPRDDAGLQRVALVVDRRVRAVVATQPVLGGVTARCAASPPGTPRTRHGRRGARCRPIHRPSPPRGSRPRIRVQAALT